MPFIFPAGKDPNFWQALTHAMKFAWWGESTDSPALILALNNEGIQAVNAAGTGVDELIRANAFDQVEFVLSVKQDNPSVGQVATQTNSATASTTLTAANISGGSGEVYLNMTGALGGAANATLPTVAALLSLFPNPTVGASYTLRIINSSSGAFAWTVVTNTGWTLSGTMTIAQNTWREFVVNITNVATPAATLTAVGTGTQS
jgi:hypothetical protein